MFPIKVDEKIVHCFMKGFKWNALKKAVLMEKRNNKEYDLETQIEEAKRAWLIAQDQMQWADKDMLEAAILHTTACERRYISLLLKARNKNYTAWDQQLTPVATKE